MRTRPPSPLRHREFRLYFVGNLTSNCGTWLQNVALGVFMLELTHRSTWVGITAFALFLPVVFLTLPAGALADRVSRLKILMLSQLFAAALATLLTGLAAAGAVNRYAVVAIAFGIGVSTAIAIPAMQALLPHLVPESELAEAIQMNAVTFNVARVVGPIVAAVTLAGLGTTWAFGINAASFLVLAGALALIGTPPYPRAGGSPGPIREGLRYAWEHVRTRTALLGVAVIGVTLDPITTLSPAMAKEFGHRNAAGWLVAAWGFGAVFTITVGAPLLRAAARHGLGWAGLVALSIGIAGFGAAQGFPLAMAALFVAGAGYITAAMTFTTTIQRDVPERLRGRVMALWSLAFLGTRPLAGLVDGRLADMFSPHVAAAVFAIPAVVAAVIVRRGTVIGAAPSPPPAAEV
jgi:MFS family permease